MWAHDLEKRQHAFAAGELHPLPPRTVTIAGSEDMEMRPRRTEMGGAPGDLAKGTEERNHHRRPSEDSNVTGSWIDVDEQHSDE